MRRFLWIIATLAVAAWLLWMTLRPQAQASADLAYLTTPAVEQGISPRFLIDFLGNIVVFVPLGAAAAFTLAQHPPRSRLLWATLTGALLSAAIELTQLAIPSRVSAIDDWLLNTIGTFTGAVIAAFLLRRQDHQTTRLPD